MNAPYVYTQTRPPTATLDLDDDQTFTVDCAGFDTLILQIAYENVAGTALTFSFASSTGVNDADNPYTKAKVNYATGAIDFAATFTGSVSDDVYSEISFSLTGIGLAGVGNVDVTVSCADSNGDTIVVTPILARTS